MRLSCLLLAVLAIPVLAAKAPPPRPPRQPFHGTWRLIRTGHPDALLLAWPSGEFLLLENYRPPVTGKWTVRPCDVGHPMGEWAWVEGKAPSPDDDEPPRTVFRGRVRPGGYLPCRDSQWRFERLSP
jgi:hypothetical protein